MSIGHIFQKFDSSIKLEKISYRSRAEEGGGGVGGTTLLNFEYWIS